MVEDARIAIRQAETVINILEGGDRKQLIRTLFPPGTMQLQRINRIRNAEGIGQDTCDSRNRSPRCLYGIFKRTGRQHRHSLLPPVKDRLVEGIAGSVVRRYPDIQIDGGRNGLDTDPADSDRTFLIGLDTASRHPFADGRRDEIVVRFIRPAQLERGDPSASGIPELRLQKTHHLTGIITGLYVGIA